MDEHPGFVQDYFVRKASRSLIDNWLIAHSASVSAGQYSLTILNFYRLTIIAVSNRCLCLALRPIVRWIAVDERPYTESLSDCISGLFFTRVSYELFIGLGVRHCNNPNNEHCIQFVTIYECRISSLRALADDNS